MGDHTGDEEPAEPATAVTRFDVDVAEVGVGRAIGHYPRKTGLLTGGCTEPKTAASWRSSAELPHAGCLSSSRRSRGNGRCDRRQGEPDPWTPHTRPAQPIRSDSASPDSSKGRLSACGASRPVLRASAADRPAQSVARSTSNTDMEGVLSTRVVGGCVVGRCRGAVGAARAEGPVWSTAGSD